MSPSFITPREAEALVRQGARIIDIRDPDEHLRERIPGAENRPVAHLTTVPGDAPVIWHCRSGMRTAAHAPRLAGAAAGDCYILEGGIDAWRKAGLATVTERRPIEVMRQVQITAGSLVLIGVVLGLLVAPAFLGLSAFVGAGLVFAGASGWCGMARLLALMPWNRLPEAKA